MQYIGRKTQHLFDALTEECLGNSKSFLNIENTLVENPKQETQEMKMITRANSGGSYCWSFWSGISEGMYWYVADYGPHMSLSDRLPRE